MTKFYAKHYPKIISTGVVSGGIMLFFGKTYIGLTTLVVCGVLLFFL